MYKSADLDFILQFQEDVLRFCFFLCRNEQWAQDLAQETFIKALQSKTIAENPKPYLFQIAKNTFIDQSRKNNRVIKSDDQLETESIEPVDLDVWKVLFSLEADDQDILLLMDREGLSLNEASVVLGLPESTLKSRLFRARENFKKKWNS